MKAAILADIQFLGSPLYPDLPAKSGMNFVLKIEARGELTSCRIFGLNGHDIFYPGHHYSIKIVLYFPQEYGCYLQEGMDIELSTGIHTIAKGKAHEGDGAIIHNTGKKHLLS